MTATWSLDRACSEFDDDYRVVRPPKAKESESAFAPPAPREFVERLAKERDVGIMAPDPGKSWE